MISKPEIVKYSVTWDVPRVYLPAKSAPARLGPFVDTRPLRAPMPWTRLAALASGLAKRLASCFASAKRRWHALMVRLGTRSRQPARTTAPAESVQRVAQLSEPLLVAAVEEPLVSDAADGRCWWTRKQRKAAQKLRVQRSVMLSRAEAFEEAFEEVRLSSDLAPLVQAPLQLEDGAPATAAKKPPGRKSRKRRKAAHKQLVQRRVEENSVGRVAQLYEPLVVAAAKRLPGRKARKQRMTARTLSVQRTVEEVLLSSDLVPHILAQLRAEDGAAAAVCSHWDECWEEKLDAKLPLSLKFWSLWYDCGVTDSDAEEADWDSLAEGEDCLVTLGDHYAFDRWTRGSESTLWLKSKGDQQYVKQVRSLAAAVQAQEKAEGTNTYLFMKHPSDRISKQDRKERGDTAAEHDAYNVKYHHYVPLDRRLPTRGRRCL